MKRVTWGVIVWAAGGLLPAAPLDFDLAAQPRAALSLIGPSAGYGAELLALHGDFNGDGRVDPVISGFFNTASSEVVVVWGALPASGEVDLSNPALPRTRIYPATGQCAYLPDIDGDGRDELLISDGGGGYLAGRPDAFVIYGDAAPPPEIDLTAAAGTSVTRIAGARTVPAPGVLMAVASGGDFDNDGSADVLVADRTLQAQGGTGGEGRAFLIRGPVFATRPNLVQLTSIAPPLGFPIEGAAPNENDGADVAFANVNGDPFSDLVISGQRAYVIFGLSAPPPPQVQLATLGTEGITFNPILNPGEFFRLGRPGNLSGIATGETLLLTPSGQRVVHMVQTNPGLPSTIDLTAFPTVTHSGVLGEFRPIRETSADLNNDRFPDLVVGEVIPAGPGQSSAYLITDPLTAPPDVQSYTGRDAIRLRGTDTGPATGDALGLTTGVADIDGDGFPDLLVSAPGDDTARGPDTGALHVLSFTPPRPTTAYHFDSNQSGTPNAGERFVVEFDQDLVVQPGLILPGLFRLTGGADTLGTTGFTALPSPFSNRRVLMTLGLAPSFTVLGAASALDISAAGFVAEAINNEMGVNVSDLGVPGVDDDGVDLRTPLVENTAVVTAAAGGTVSVTNSADALYTGHSVTLPPGATPEDASVTLEPPVIELGLASATAIRIEEAATGDGLLSFTAPFTLTLEYRDADFASRALGQREDFMRVCELIQTGPASYEYRPVVGSHQIDPANNRVTVTIAPSTGGDEPPGPSRRAVVPSGFVGTYASLPIETVDERSMWMRQATGGDPGPGRRGGSGPPAILIPGPNGQYLNHLISIPGWEEDLSPTASSLQITIRSALLVERTGVGSEQYFPDQSFAIFTVEVEDFGGNPVAFTDPVDVQVQFIPSSNPDATDVVDFGSSVGYEPQMRLVRSHDTNPPDFAFVASPEYTAQSADPDTDLVSVTGLDNFVDSDGVTVYGVVVDPSAPAATAVWSWEMYR